jgi:uncharacterized cupredoxin-like copper-binding protein
MPKPNRPVVAAGFLLTSIAAMLATELALPIPASAHEDHGTFSAGQPGDPKKPARVIKVKMFEGSGKMGYEPARIEVRKGEQVRFVLQNDGEEDHEFVLATVTENRKHAEVMKKNPDMEHDDPNSKRLQPHRNGEIVWRFTKRGEFEFACLIPGHYEKGMVGKIIVK